MGGVRRKAATWIQNPGNWCDWEVLDVTWGGRLGEGLESGYLEG